MISPSTPRRADARSQALGWLARRLAWERRLSVLRSGEPAISARAA